MSSFWNLWIIALTVANIAFALWLLNSTKKRKAGDSDAGPETTGHTWDGDLAEYNNPLPRWWLGMFYISIVFGLGYLALYPGLGAFAGLNKWSSASQWSAEVAQSNASTAPIYARYASMSNGDLQKDTEAMNTARHLFGVNCAQCHGADGHGARGFPNLSATNWQWGREPETVIETITGGRQAQMPAWGAVIGKAGVESVSEYVYTLSGRTGEPAKVAAGKEIYSTYCVACHGPEGHGMAAVGAPDLSDQNWLYGGSRETIALTVNEGRAGQMPAHGGRLSAVQIKLLAAYVLSLTGGASAAGT